MSQRSSTNKHLDLEGVLRKSWYRLRLSVRSPSRVPTWDAIVLTAASPEQAALYEWQLKRAIRFGRISDSTVTLAVPDPDGHRIGSGAATLNAILALANHYKTSQVASSCSDGSHESSENEASTSMINLLRKKHILLLHAGGDSKRVPWANPMGKVFLPLPYLAADDLDGPVPLLFDHILAISSCARQAYNNQGGLFIMTGDVLPCFDASAMVLPEDTSCIITVPITLDIASNHGVIVASKTGNSGEICSVNPVANLLQKPNLEELNRHHAILDDGRTLLDTGIIAVRGKAWEDLVTLSCLSQPMISELVNTRKEMSLYEDLVAAWVPARHEWLRSRPLGEELVRRLGKQTMYSYCAYDLLFLHFGTSSEVLDHLSGIGTRLVGRRHLCSIPATTMSDIAASAIIVSSKISPGVSIGEDSLVYGSSISGGIQIGSLSIVVGVNIPEKNDRTTNDPYTFLLPDRHCLWEVPLIGSTERVIVFCGLHDNPKNPLSKDGTFCGKPWEKVLDDLGIQENDLWSSQEKCLWNAKLFPILPYFEMLNLANWLMGLGNNGKNEGFLSLWKTSKRVSLEELHRSIDFPQMCLISSNHQADLAAKIARACLTFGLLGRNLTQLCQEILQMKDSGDTICRNFLALCPNLLAQNSKILPKSRAYQVQADLLRACSNHEEASEVEHQVWAAVADETASAVRYGFKEHLFQSSNQTSFKGHDNNNLDGFVGQTFRHRKVKVELPVRVDFVGGWSDTPPWSLERAGCVLNMAITLDNSLPIGTIIETTKKPGLLITDDASNEIYIEDLSSIATPFDQNDPFRLVKSALLVTGTLYDRILVSMGLRVKTWAHIPRGSGLGTSSILAAAVVKGLLRITDGDESNENVARLVLVLEQIMGTGGGWQDQIGGLYPGIKFTTSFPGIPLRLQVIPLLASPRLVAELQERLLVVFTGQVRLAHQVLQKVVTRYLQRDNLLISSIKRLAELAKTGREALMNCNVDELGDIMMETWRLHQELDPHCSNEFVDRLFAFADRYCCGYKLVGAGGGGFALLLAKKAESAWQLRRALEENHEFDVKIARGRRSSAGKRERDMGFLSNKVERSEIKAGDHIYTYRAVFAYSHHGIFVGGNKVVHFTHFTPDRETSSSTETSSNSYDGMSKMPSSCQTYPDCGFRQPKSGVVLSCLDCFLRNGALYSFEYGVTPTFFLAKVRGGTCTTATSDGPGTVIHRAMYLLQNGFGNYDVFQNNCEDFALYCKTGILTVDKLGIGRSGQASSLVGAPLAALLSSPLKLLIPSPVGVATMTAGMYCMSRYATDIGVRTDIVKVAVEDLAVNLGWMDGLEEEFQANKASSENKNQVIHVD